MAQPQSDMYVTALQFTPHTHRDVYPAIDPTKTPALSQEGKVVVVTGATRGIGRTGFLPAFAKANPSGMVLIGRSEKELEAAAAEVHKINPKIHVLTASGVDALDAKAIKGAWAKVQNTFGHADVLVANAAILEGGPLANPDHEKWWRQMVSSSCSSTVERYPVTNLLPFAIRKSTSAAPISTYRTS